MSTLARLAGAANRALARHGARRVAMFHVTRCGSRVLGDLLNQHPAMLWDAEIFAPPRIAQLPALFRPLLAGDPMRNLELRTLRAGRKVYGHEATLNQLDEIGMAPANYLEELERRGIEHFVRLERKNLLRVIVSHVSARTRARWHDTANTRARLRPVAIDLERCHFRRDTRPLIEHLREESAAQLALNGMLKSRSTLWLTYEKDIADDPRRAYARVCEYLGLEPFEAEVRYAPTNPFGLDQLIENFDQVCARLRGTEFDWMTAD